MFVIIAVVIATMMTTSRNNNWLEAACWVALLQGVCVCLCVSKESVSSRRHRSQAQFRSVLHHQSFVKGSLCALSPQHRLSSAGLDHRWDVPLLWAQWPSRDIRVNLGLLSFMSCQLRFTQKWKFSHVVPKLYDVCSSAEHRSERLLSGLVLF